MAYHTFKETVLDTEQLNREVARLKHEASLADIKARWVKEDYWMVTSVLCLFLALGAFILGVYLGRNELKREAVKTGHAEWFNDKDGSPEWKWKQ